MIRSKYSSLLGMAIAVILFIGMDKWLYRQERLARQTPDFQLYVIWMVISGFAIFVILCVLSWVTLLKSQRSYPISILFLVVGIIVYTYPVLYLWLPLWIPWLPVPYISAYDSPFPYTGIFIAVLGFLHLFLPAEANNSPMD